MLNASARRINSILNLIDRKSTYLEIGVETGQTFFNVSADFKIAVDPCFLFDVNIIPKCDNVKYFEISSDSFFGDKVCDSKFDVVFIDGLHTWDQAYRDFCSALLVTHERSVIILDDTFPCDVFSCGRDQIETIMMRSLMTGDSSNAWHGDVYKVILLLQLFHPMLSYCTIVTDGNPQTIIWRTRNPLSSEKPKPFICDAGALNIATLDYLWFLRNQESYNLTSEDEGLALVIADLFGG